MNRRGARLSFVLLILLNCLIWNRSRYAAINPAHLKPLPLRLVARFVESTPANATIKQCHPRTLPIEEQCAHGWEFCPQSETFFGIPYLQNYYCASSGTRPLIFTGLTIWLIFLFSTLGISASDFFCPNLATISAFLGLDENVAGVTFLAFGNGSPDLFSTFSAFRADSGSLAVGELLGAASFIVSVVAGSMCIIKPFRVERYPFLRDVGFFTCAVALLLAITHDGRIRAWESMGLVGVYVVYVVIVVVGSYWERRRALIRAREELIRQEYTDESPAEPYHDEDVSPNDPLEYSMSLSIPNRKRALSESLPALRRSSTSSSHLGPAHHEAEFTSKQRLAQLPSFSLLGALEFRQVINSLQHDSTANALDVFETYTPYAGNHYLFHGYHSSRPHSPTSLAPLDEENNPFEESLSVPLHHRQDSGSLRAKAPSIVISTPGGEGSTISLPREDPPTRVQRLRFIARKVFQTIFPTLHEFKSKSWAGMIVSVFATPAVLALTLTLPVVIFAPDESEFTEGKSHHEERLLDFEEEGTERALTAEAAGAIEQLDVSWNKWLMAAQCIFGPLFCASVLFTRTTHFTLIMIGTAIAGTVVAVLVAIFADYGNDKGGKMIRAFMGFGVAIVWIMAIADEVVDVLQTFGFIFGLSDAIIGLTVFAVGNSMADLIADISVAAFAPIMGFSACFGGPMLNILLGVGGSGTYITHQTGQDVRFHFSSTLLVSTIGLLILLVATLIVVPYNNYWLSRSWGIFLIAGYTVVMIVNIVVEIKQS